MNDWHVDQRKILDGRSKEQILPVLWFLTCRMGGVPSGSDSPRHTAELREMDPSSRYGVKHVFRCTSTTPDHRNPCIWTVWQVRGGDYWLVTAYPFG